MALSKDTMNKKLLEMKKQVSLSLENYVQHM